MNWTGTWTVEIGETNSFADVPFYSNRLDTTTSALILYRGRRVADWAALERHSLTSKKASQ